MDFGIHVVTDVALAPEMTIAFPTVMVHAAAYVMLLPRLVACEVAVAIIAWPVGIGIAFVLLKGSVVWERSCAANTIGHWMVVVRSEEETSHENVVTEYI